MGRHRNKRPPPSSRRRYAEPAPAYVPSRRRRPPPGTDDKLAQLKQLGELRDAGVLTDAEFEAQKGKILYA